MCSNNISGHIVVFLTISNMPSTDVRICQSIVYLVRMSASVKAQFTVYCAHNPTEKAKLDKMTKDFKLQMKTDIKAYTTWLRVEEKFKASRTATELPDNSYSLGTHGRYHCCGTDQVQAHARSLCTSKQSMGIDCVREKNDTDTSTDR